MKELTTEEKITEIINFYKNNNELELVKKWEEKFTLWKQYCIIDNNYFQFSQGKIQNKIITDKIIEDKKLLKEFIDDMYKILFKNIN